ncbi:MAG: bifunctional phosphopantothenoylcysteine decarboxylase/phosphopantothenate--cysteine ligase CoaBC, partial [Oscillospiraceae bacterium]
MAFQGKTVVVGVTSSIAAYKSVSLVSELKKMGINVIVVMTKNSAELVTPLTFETISKNKVYIDTFNREFSFDVHHISLAKKADAFIVCPATANFIAKMANGIADDMLSTTFLAMRCPVLVAPAMNTAMYENIATTTNLQTLKNRGIKIIEPESGMLACEDVGKGRLADISVIKEHILNALSENKDYIGKKVLITAGATCESIDPVRYITNHSSGKMGYALARACSFRGADVTLISGKTSLPCPVGVKKIDITSAEDMFGAVEKIMGDYDIIIKAAAVADYTPSTVSHEKIKKSSDGNLTL